MATKKLKNVASGGWPKINQGSHLTVKTFEDGSTELVWDHDALIRDVQEAIASVSKKSLVKETEAKVKKTRAKKVEELKATKAPAKKTPAKKKVSK